MAYNVTLSVESGREKTTTASNMMAIGIYRSVCVCQCHVIYTCRSFLEAFFCFSTLPLLQRMILSVCAVFLKLMRVCLCLHRKYVQCWTSIALPFAFKLSLETQYCNTNSDWHTGIHVIAPLVRQACVRLILWPNERQTLFSLKIEIWVYTLNNIKPITAHQSITVCVERRQTNATCVCTCTFLKRYIKENISTTERRCLRRVDETLTTKSVFRLTMWCCSLFTTIIHRIQLVVIKVKFSIYRFHRCYAMALWTTEQWIHARCVCAIRLTKYHCHYRNVTLNCVMPYVTRYMTLKPSCHHIKPNRIDSSRTAYRIAFKGLLHIISLSIRFI